MINVARAETIAGWMTPTELRWLAHRASECDLIAEIGCFCGRSTRALADHVKRIVFAIDPWEPYDYGKQLEPGLNCDQIFATFLRNMDGLLGRKVVPLRMKNHEASGFVSYPYPILDMVFIDGDHEFDSVFEDIHIWQQRVGCGGLICGHDYGHPDCPGVKKAVDTLLPGAICAPGTSIWWKRL